MVLTHNHIQEPFKIFKEPYFSWQWMSQWMLFKTLF